MLRFAEMLKAGWQRRGIKAFLVQPEPWLAQQTPPSLRKWAVYVDQYLRFPRRAAQMADAIGWDKTKPTVFHICDHSNSIYLRGLRGRSVVLTCHDLLAVRGAMGEPTFCPASPTGKILQKMILHYLRCIPWVACDSDATCADFRRLTGRVDDKHVETIHLALNAPFAPVPAVECQQRLGKYRELRAQPYILHVGSSLPRKNRAGVLRAFALARANWTGRVVFAGEPLSESERSVIREFNLPSSSVYEIPNPTHDELAALYSRAHALVFPSYAEGYGWPVLEAQACGCPVICSNVTSLPEVAGSAALTFAPEDFQGMANAIVSLADKGKHAALAAAGILNAASYSEDRMFDRYRKLYEKALA